MWSTERRSPGWSHICDKFTMAEAETPVVDEGAPAPKGTAKRDGLIAMETEMQAKWEANKAFEVDAPVVSCVCQ
jgi:hypothetical protein